MSIKVIKTIKEMRKFRQSLSRSIGFVPTMGYLHAGHLSLVKLAKKENDYIIVSIFVNPKQFGPNEDFQKYPRDTDRDLRMLKKEKVDVVFLPDISELYPAGFETYISIEEITNRLEGAIRPGHFKGVATVVAKLFNIIQPARAYFGQKDAQQVVVIKKMATDLNIPVDLIIGKIVRETDGLALSSRNVYLNTKERKEATIIFKSLCLAQELVKKGERNSKKIKSEMEKLINTTSGKIDYISIADKQSLDEVKQIDKEALVSLAVRFGKTRLIDNIFI